MSVLHIGTKLVKLLAMTRQEYNDYRSWQLTKDEQHLADEPGFLVEYIDGGRANDERHKGYISWSPEDVAKASYKSSGAMTFGMATEAAKRGYKISRSGWNGAKMFAFINKNESKFLTVDKANGGFENYPMRPSWVLKTAQDDIATWAPSGSDSLAEDWCIVD